MDYKLTVAQKRTLSVMGAYGNILPTSGEGRTWGRYLNEYGTSCEICPTRATMAALVKKGFVRIHNIKDYTIYYELTEQGWPLTEKFAEERMESDNKIRKRLVDEEFGEDISVTRKNKKVKHHK